MMKGETSGMIQEIVSLSADCEGKSLLLRVKPHGPGCHKGYHSCYFRRLDPTTGAWEITAEPEFDPEVVYGKTK